MGFLGTRPVDIAMDPNVKLLNDEREIYGEPRKYHRLVRKVNYLTITWPIIFYAVIIISQLLDATWVSHWEAVIRILRYLKNAPGLELLYKLNGHIRIKGLQMQIG